MLGWSKEELFVIAAAVVVLVMGIILERILGGWSNAFQRSGSAMVCVGLLFAARDLKKFYADRFEDLVRKLKEKLLENDIVFSDEELDAGVRGSTNYFISRARSIRESGEKRVILIDAIVLILGTVIWGFGDLII